MTHVWYQTAWPANVMGAAFGKKPAIPQLGSASVDLARATAAARAIHRIGRKGNPDDIAGALVGLAFVEPTLINRVELALDGGHTSQ